MTNNVIVVVEMMASMIDFYGIGVKHSEEFKPLAIHLVNAGWRKIENPTEATQ